MDDPRFAKSPLDYISAFLLIQKDLKVIFDYIQPADKNLLCFSYRIHELLIRTCIEVEANCKAILVENNYQNNPENLNMNDYKKINKTHKLSEYVVTMPFWLGIKKIRKPFTAWNRGGTLSWYQAYNNTKHNRQEKFIEANLNNLINACCGLFVILSAQFHNHDYLNDTVLKTENSFIGDYFQVEFPKTWKSKNMYDFDYDQIWSKNNLSFPTLKF